MSLLGSKLQRATITRFLARTEEATPGASSNQGEMEQLHDKDEESEQAFSDEDEEPEQLCDEDIPRKLEI
ncbi:hypothetical protein FRC06_009201, partial [Ceratobasidium sp. 370]